MSFQFALVTFLTFQMGIVAYFDLRTRKVLNIWSILNIALFALLAIFFPAHVPHPLERLSLPLILLAAGFVLFMLKIMGGGDGKYLFTFFLLLPLSWQGIFFENILWGTIAFAGFFLSLNTFKNRKRIILHLKKKEYSQIKKYYGTFFPFVPILFVSWIWFIIKNFT